MSIQTVDKNPNIDNGVEASLIAQATPIRDLMSDLIANGVCTGSECLPDPKVGAVSALDCEIGKLLAEVAADVEPAPNPLEVESYAWLTIEEIRRLPQILASNLEFINAWERGEIQP